MSEENKNTNEFKETMKKTEDFFKKGFSKMQNDWNKMGETLKNTFVPEEKDKKNPLEFMQNATKNAFDKFQSDWTELVNKNSQNTVGTQENTNKVKEFFDKQNVLALSKLQKMHSKMIENQKGMQDQVENWSADNEKKFLDSVKNSGKNWNEFMVKQQKTFETNMSGMSKSAWKTNLQILLFAIPIIIVLALLFSIIKPFL